MSYYTDEDDLDVRIRRRHSPEPVRYVSPVPRPYYPAPYLGSDQGLRLVARSRSRSRSHERILPQHAGPVIIQNKIYNDMPSDDEYRPPRRCRSRHRSMYSRSRSRSHSHTRASLQNQHMANEDWQRELNRRALERIRIDQARDREQQKAEKERKSNEELHRAKEELNAIKQREAQAEEEERIRRDMEFQRLRDEERAQAERAIRDQEVTTAVQQYIQNEAERHEREEGQKKAAEKEFQRRMQEQLLASGLDEGVISAIMKKEKVTAAKTERATYTRMPRKYLSIETLREFNVEFELDSADPAGFVIIKRPVPEWEQDCFWKHTKDIREKRVVFEEKSHKHRHKSDVELIVRKKERKRS